MIEKKPVALYVAAILLAPCACPGDGQSFISSINFNVASSSPCSEEAVNDNCVVKELVVEDPLRGSVHFVWVTVPDNNVRLVVTRVRWEKFVERKLLGKFEDDVAVLSGSFVVKSGTSCLPQGREFVGQDEGEVDDGELQKDSGGFLLEINDDEGNRVKIVRYNELPSQSTIRYGLQSPTLLVMNGRIDKPLRNDRFYDRVAMGIDRNRNVIVAGAWSGQSALSAYELAEFLTVSKVDGGPDVEAAINLEGKPGFIYLPQKRRQERHKGHHLGIACIPNIVRLVKDRGDLRHVQ